MTAPIQEPNNERALQGLAYSRDQIFRRPGPVGDAGSTPWIAVYDNVYLGQEINTSAGATLVAYPRLDKSDDYLEYFAWDTTSGSPLTDYYYTPQLLLDGVYSITAAMASEDLGGGNFTMRFRINIVDGTYAGRQNSDVLLLANQQFSFSTYSISYPYFLRTWVIPIQKTGADPVTVAPSILLSRPSAGSDFDIIFRNRLWITRLGDLNHTADLNTDDDPGPYGT